MPSKIAVISVVMVIFALLISPGAVHGVSISSVSVSTESFAPAKGQEVVLSYELDASAKVSIKVYDPDYCLIRKLIQDSQRAKGSHQEVWDGKDMDDVVVPNEAYFFTIVCIGDAGDEVVYDPTRFSGGDQFDITEADINTQAGRFTYRLADPSRILVRIGIEGGPLLHSPVIWKPRVTGEITEYWNGWDQDGLIDLINHPRFKMIITGFKLVDNSVIAYGNKAEDYIAYKSRVGDSRPSKPPRTAEARTDIRISTHYMRPRIHDKPIGLSVSFPEIDGREGEAVLLSGEKQLVRVELDEVDLDIFANEPFEVSFFLDGEYYSEEETGYVPYNWVWNLSDVEKGEHVLTVNLSSFKDIVGINSHKILIE